MDETYFLYRTILPMKKIAVLCFFIVKRTFSFSQVYMEVDSVADANVFATFTNMDKRNYQIMPVFDIITGLGDSIECLGYLKGATTKFSCLGPSGQKLKSYRYGKMENRQTLFDLIYPPKFLSKLRNSKDMGLFLQKKKRRALILPAYGRLQVVIKLYPKLVKRKNYYISINNKLQVLSDSMAANCFIQLGYGNHLTRGEIGNVSVSTDSIFTGCITSKNKLSFKLKTSWLDPKQVRLR